MFVKQNENRQWKNRQLAISPLVHSVFNVKIHSLYLYYSRDVAKWGPQLINYILVPISQSSILKNWRKDVERSVSGPFFEQLVTLVMFFSKVCDVENHVSIMRKSEISVIFRAGPICQPVTGAASIEKNFFWLIFDTRCPKWVTSNSIQPPHSYYTNIVINKKFFSESDFIYYK